MRLLFSSLPLLAIFSLFKIVHLAEIERNNQVLTEVVLIGATGDLAKKYLWNGLFELYRKHTTPDELLKVYGAAREENDVGLLQLQEILSSKIKCDSSLTSSSKGCEAWKREFLERTTYHKLKKDKDYEAFCKGIHSNGAAKLVRIFYLSVPPFAYGSISKSIHKHCRPFNVNGEAFLRVVLEKPFGADLESAISLASELEKYFQEDEIYRVDHYLGKVGVQQILNFRIEHVDTYGPLWNKDHIQSVEIALKEKDDCSRRTEYYNQYGVLRDVMQNHMMEIMALVAMETHNTNNITSMSQSKLQFLNDIRTIHRHSTIVGQYKEYIKHCELERGKSNPIDRTTPTFAAVVLHSRNSRWNNIPFIMVSGKQLAERTAYVRVLFQSKFTMDSQNSERSCSLRQIVFHIQGGVLKKPSLVISKSLPKILKFSNWKLLESKPEYLYDCPGSTFDIYVAPTTQDAYTVLIAAIYQGRKEHFVGTKDLLASWQVWSPLVHSLTSTQPRVYTTDYLKMLDFTLVGKQLQFVNNDGGSCSSNDRSCAGDKIVNRYLPTTFRGTTLITGTLSKVVTNLAERLLNAARQAVKSKGVFHLALSGGSTPSKLFEQLVYFTPEFPWHATHVWFADERCVDFTNNLSNYNFVHRKLLDHVPILSINIYPMPVKLRNGMCSFNDKGAELYQSKIKSIIGKPKFDYVLLGLGTDGHVASIFPNTEFLTEKNWVTLTESKVLGPKGFRMTLTLEIINKASNVGILVLGKKKAKIVQKVSQLSINEVVSEIPVSAVKPEGGKLVWYIDDVAMKDVNSSNNI